MTSSRLPEQAQFSVEQILERESQMMNQPVEHLCDAAVDDEDTRVRVVLYRTTIELPADLGRQVTVRAALYFGDRAVTSSIVRTKRATP